MAQLRRVYGQIIDRTGWAFPVVDALRLDEVSDLYQHWQEEPPLSVVARALANWKPADATPREPTPMSADEMQRFAAALQRSATVGG